MPFTDQPSTESNVLDTVPATPTNDTGEVVRISFLVGGAALVVAGLSRRSLGGFLVSLVGGALIYRGATRSFETENQQLGSKSVKAPPGLPGFVRRELSTPAGRMAVYEAGAGTPIVFLHGIGGGASSWTWNFVAPAFTATHRVIVPDFVGWGSSEHPARFVLFEDYVASLEALLDNVGTPAIVVAQSLAAGFAMELAERRPELIQRFIFNTPAGGKDFDGDAFGPLARATVTSFASIPGVGFAFYRALFHRRIFIKGWFQKQGFADPSKVTPEIVDAFLWSARQPNAACSALPFASGALRYDIAPYFERLKTPASQFWGAEETQVGLPIGQRLAALRPKIPLGLIKNSKACPELEQPHAVIATIRRALSLTS